ncbi:hypothetical protein N7456_007799 [Penicillium angulare]|uniref:Ankyrin repeat protein n=1 Tax=Penicillium angulare TaxID=116970 RepID=A0A9W9K8L5_9EURO|nr:hypothetical protein N7456_007799 [Penicillium angulare]
MSSEQESSASSSPEDALFKAIKENALDGVKQALENGASPDAKDGDGITALLLATKEAIESENLEVISFLLDKVVNPNLESSEDDDLVIPLGYAVRSDASIDLIKLLLEKGADVNYQPYSDVDTPLLSAFRNHDVEIADLLLEFGADPNQQEDYWGSPLHYAAYYGYPEHLGLLLKKRADKDLKKYRNGATPLADAIRGFEFECAEILITAGADINIVDDYDNTLLHYAVCSETPKFCNLLLSQTRFRIQDINARDVDGNTPLFKAAEYSELCTEWLLGKGAIVDMVNLFQSNPLLQCAKRGNIHAAQLLLKDLPHIIDKVDDLGRGIFHYAAESREPQFLKWLMLEKFCNPNVVNKCDEMGNTPLHVVLRKLKTEYEVQSALMGKMSSEALCRKNNNRQSILSLTVDNEIGTSEKGDNDSDSDYQIDSRSNSRNMPFLSDLLSRPLDVEYPQPGSWPTIFHSDQEHVKEVAERLQEKLSAFQKPRDVVFWAARNGAQGLVTKGLADLHGSKEDRRIISKALYWASAGNQIGIVESLIGAYKDEIRFEEKTTIEALQVAAFNGDTSIVRSLLKFLRDALPHDPYKPTKEDAEALYWAVTWSSGHARDVVRYLIMNGADPNSFTDDDKTTILKWTRDRAKEGSEEAKKMLVFLESPIRVPRRPDAPQKPKERHDQGDPGVCTISDFYCKDEGYYTMQRISQCRDVVYTEGPSKKMKESQRAWFPTDELRLPDFRWIHLPSNDWQLAKDLMDMIYWESSGSNLEYSRWEAFVKRTRREHAGSPQSRFMYPTLQFETKDHGSGESFTLMQLVDRETKSRTEKAKDKEKGKEKEKEKDKEKDPRGKDSGKPANSSSEAAKDPPLKNTKAVDGDHIIASSLDDVENGTGDGNDRPDIVVPESTARPEVQRSVQENAQSLTEASTQEVGKPNPGKEESAVEGQQKDTQHTDTDQQNPVNSKEKEK